MKRHEARPELKILAYFRELQANLDPGEQEQKLIAFRQRLEHKGIIYKTYKTPEEFKELFTHDIYNVVLRIRLSPFKHECIKSFWQFGEAERPTYPKLAILYPPVQREVMGHPRNKKFWLSRLVPNIYFEDYKAIHKVQKSLGLLGFRDYRVYSQVDAPSDLQFMNRVWVCVPRYRRGLEQLDTYKEVRRFVISPRIRDRHATITWRTDSGEQVIVKSPLDTYLREQRKKMDVSGEWNAQLGKVFAKDFAVLARFSDKAHDNLVTQGYLQDYFFSGIRGLGTWGAGWYIDRKYKDLVKYPRDSDLQILLEVLFCDDSIVDVRDVSSEPAEYFVQENSIPIIRQRIKDYMVARNIPRVTRNMPK